MADVPLLTAITETFGPNMWFNTIVALTHAAAAPPDGSSGPISYDTYTRTRTQLLQQNIRCNPDSSPCPFTSCCAEAVSVQLYLNAALLLLLCTIAHKAAQSMFAHHEVGYGTALSKQVLWSRPVYWCSSNGVHHSVFMVQW